MPTLQFKGKPFVQNHHLAVKYHQLVPNEKNSLTDKISLHDNLIIQGDNLKALKALLPTYGGKVKCIYIDPPYNTGNEHWVYNDNVNSPMMQEWLGKEVDTEDMTRHDKWLCMMMPRLKLLRELLAEDGSIFISIDDNEQHRLRILCDEIFGEQNFVGNLTWESTTQPINSGEARYGLQKNIEHILFYSKSKSSLKKFYLNEISDELNYPHQGKLGKCRFEIIEKSDAGGYNRETMKFEILGQTPREGKRWQIGKETAETLLSKNRLELVDGIVKRAVYPEDEEEKKKFKPFWSHFNSNENGTAQKGKSLLNDLMNKAIGFDTVKPPTLIKKLLSYITSNNDIILDSFAGSGTTAHAVLNLNKEDGGNRKFILVEMEDYTNTITAERVRRVIKGVPKSKNFSAGTGGSFSYFELGKPIEMNHILDGTNLPSYVEFARYLFYTATGEQFVENKINEQTGFIGESNHYEVYLIYQPDIEYLKSTALTLERAKALPEFKGKQRLVFAPMKYLDQHFLRDLRIDFCQLPYEVYKMEK